MIPAERRPVIVDALRTPIGTRGGALRSLDTTELLAPLLAELQRRGPEPVAEVVVGNIRGPGGNPARVALLAAGLADSTAAVTLDRQCGSGLAAVEHAVAMLCGLTSGFVIAGGVQSASTEPLTAWPAQAGDEAARWFTRPPFTAGDDPDMGVAADLVAAEAGIDRERQDAYAVRSHQRALAAQAAGTFAAELSPVGGVERDERPRDLTIQRLARFRPAFSTQGTATAGNSCGVNDGAAAVLLCDAATARRHGLAGLEVVDVVSVGCRPDRPGTGAAAAIGALVTRTGVDLSHVASVEVNEAFAGQVLACLDAVGIDEHRNCPDGGAIALGHPWAASGAVLVTRLFTRLVRQSAEPGALGLAAIAIGGGQGTAMLVRATGGRR